MSAMRSILVAVSGGIDSAVSLHLLRRQHPTSKIEAVFMNNWDARDEPAASRCTLDSDLESAGRACRLAGVPLHRVNLCREYWLRVFQPSLEMWAGGRETPNPDIMCNREIKFGVLLQWAKDAGFDTLATGHYARIHREGDRKWLMQAKDLSKDQTYFLSRMPSDSLERAVFPLGNLEKKRVRDIAGALGMDWLLKRPESMGICFVGSQHGRSRFSAVLDAYLPLGKPGPLVILDTGQVIGEHTGSFKMTIGQNARIHSMPTKLYVAKKEGNTVYLVDSLQHPALNPKSLQTRDLNMSIVPESATGPWLCSIRSNDKHGTPVISLSETEINLEQPVFAPAPGQYAVLYQQLAGHDRLICIGSAIIN